MAGPRGTEGQQPQASLIKPQPKRARQGHDHAAASRKGWKVRKRREALARRDPAAIAAICGEISEDIRSRPAPRVPSEAERRAALRRILDRITSAREGRS